jgi:NAD(P)H dehydrogenase (quinone)
MDIVPPAVFYEVGGASAEAVEAMTQTYIERLLNIQSVDPIPFRPQNGGDYADVQVLKPHLDSGGTGHALHQSEPVFISNTFLVRTFSRTNFRGLA